MVQMYRDPHAPASGAYAVAWLDRPSAHPLAPRAPAWRHATAIDWGPERYRTRFRACWDREALHVRFDARDERPWHTMTRRDEPLWEEEVVELFLDPAGGGRYYAELEISPANVVCDLCVEAPWPSLRAVTAWDWEGLASAVEPMHDSAGRVEGWTTLARLPLASLGSLSPAARAKVPPSPGDAWGFNVFRIKRPNGPERPEEGVVYAAWSVPSGPSFHEIEAFRPLVFEGP